MFLFQPLPRHFAIRAPGRTVHHYPTLRQIADILFRGFIWQQTFITGNPGQFGQQYIVIRLVTNVVDIDVTDDPLWIYDEDRPLAVAFGTQYTVQPAYFAVRPEITQQRIRDPVKAVRPGGETWNMVNAYAQNLDIRSLELRQQCLVRRDLTCSYGGPG